MPKYTTGEIAKLCGVSVRTVQYYDSRNILVPSELSEGGRRLYSEDDLKRMKIICFLRDAGISISSIAELLADENPESVISVLLEQQEQLLKEEMEDRKAKLALISGIQKELKKVDNFSVGAIGGIAYAVENQKKLKHMHIVMLAMGIPLDLFQWIAIILWIVTGTWWPTAVWLLLDVLFGIWITVFYLKRTAYICPECHEIFKANAKEVIFAKHTPTLRKVTCTRCGYYGFCIETYGKEEKDHD